MFQLKSSMLVSSILLLSVSLYCSVAAASDVFEATPAEQDDTNTIDEISGGATSEVFETTPTEQDDINSIDEISGSATSEVFETTPAEQDDIKTIEQLNNE